MKRSVFGLCVVLGGCAPSGTVQSAADLVRAMHDRYVDTWYETVTFVQDAIFYNADGSVLREEESWWAAQLPGRLRIDVAPFEDGHATVFTNDSTYQFQDRQRVAGWPGFNQFLLQQFDVYAQPPPRTLELLDSIGYDLTKFHEDVWQGRGMYVVGADSGDAHSRQFWVERERLLLVRLLLPSGRDLTGTQEIQFNGHHPLGQGFIPTEIVFLWDGEVGLREVYRDVRADVQLPDDLFATGEYHPPGWALERDR